MPHILNITNGDSAVQIMQAANLAGDFLPWRDVLHEGPVPAKMPLAQLSHVRAQFIAQRGWGTPEQVRQSFRKRDEALESAATYEKIILWFEHDLYDQLQLLQILDWLNSHPLPGTQVSIICTQHYLGMQSPDSISDLRRYAQAVTREQLTLAARGWSAFRSSTPEKWHSLQRAKTASLPFLKPAIVRLLEEYPSCFNGLSRTAQQALQIISQGEGNPAKVFARSQAMEKRRFMADAGFWSMLQELLASRPALLRLAEGERLTLPAGPGQALTLTPAGRKVLAGAATWLEIGQVDRWIGGVHIRPGRLWCWDPQSGLRLQGP